MRYPIPGGACGWWATTEIYTGHRRRRQRQMCIRDRPHTGQRLRVGGYVQPGSLQRDPQTLDVRFKLYDARGVVDVSYKGILPDLFREGQGVVAQGVLDGERHITAQQVLAKHDENYTPPEVKNAMTPEKTGAQP